MRIQAYRETDLPAVVALFTAAVHTLGATAYDVRQCAAWAPTPPDEQAWRERLAARITRLARTHDALAGFIAYAPEGHIDLLFTAPGQARRGVATRLLQHAQADLIARGVGIVTTEASLVARPFFARQGFEVVAAHAVRLRGSTLRRFSMRKTLRPTA